MSSNPECQEPPSSWTYPEFQVAVGLPAVGRSEARKEAQCLGASSERVHTGSPASHHAEHLGPQPISIRRLNTYPLCALPGTENRSLVHLAYYSASQRKSWAQIGFKYLTLVMIEKYCFQVYWLLSIMKPQGLSEMSAWQAEVKTQGQISLWVLALAANLSADQQLDL